MILTNYDMNNANGIRYSRSLAFKGYSNNSLYEQMAKISEDALQKQSKEVQKIQKRSNFIKNYKVFLIATLALISAAGGYFARPLFISGEKNKIETLNDKIDYKKSELDNLDVAITKKCSELDGLDVAITKKRSELDSLDVTITKKCSELDGLGVAITKKRSELDILSKEAAKLDATDNTNFQDGKNVSEVLNLDPCVFLSREVAEDMLSVIGKRQGYRRTNFAAEKLNEANFDGQEMALGSRIKIAATFAEATPVRIYRNFDGTYMCRFNGAEYCFSTQGNFLSSMDIRNMYRVNLLHSLQNIDSLNFGNPDLLVAVLISLGVFDTEHDEVSKCFYCKTNNGNALKISYDIKDSKISGEIATFEDLEQAKYSKQVPQSRMDFEYTIINDSNKPGAVFTTMSEKKRENVFVISKDAIYKNGKVFIN